jgi:hypothetical protein
MFNNLLFLENRAVNEKMWRNFVDPDRQQMTIWPQGYKYTLRMCDGCLLLFPLQQCLPESTTVLLYMYIAACLIFFFY